MNMENLSLIVFTLLIQCAVGMSFGALCFGRKDNLPDKEECSLVTFWRLTAFLAVVGLGASLFHLAKPVSAPTALLNLGVSWLSNEALVVGGFCGLVVLMMLTVNRYGYEKMRALAYLVVLAGLGSLVVQGLTYAPEAMPAIANGFPFVLFFLTAVILGAGLSQVMLDDTCECSIYSTAIWVMLALLLVVPCVWSTGSEIMKATAQAWAASCLFWVAIGLFLLALILKACSQLILSVISVVIALFLSRVVFFDCTLHTSTLLGLPY